MQFNYTLKALTGQPFRATRSCFYLGLSATAPGKDRYIKMESKTEMLLAYVIYIIDIIEKLYVKLYPLIAVSLGSIIFIGLVGGSEKDLSNDYFESVWQIIIVFLLTGLMWKVGKLKTEKEKKDENYSYKRRNSFKREKPHY